MKSNKKFLLLIILPLFLIVLILFSLFIVYYTNKRGSIEGAYDTASFSAPKTCPENILGPAADFNVFMTGDMNQTYVDTEGRVAVGNNATFFNYAAGAALQKTNQDTMVVGNNINFTNGAILNGNFAYGNSYNFDKVIVPDGQIYKSKPIDFTAADTFLKQTSTYLKNIPANGTLKKISGLTELYGNDPVLNVFNIKSSDIPFYINFNIYAPTNSVVLINLDGTSGQLGYMSMHFYNGITRDKVLFNYYNATNLEITATAVEGSVIAPYATVNFHNTAFNGTLIGKNLYGDGEAHHHPFYGCINSSTYFTPTTSISKTTSITSTTTTSTISGTVNGASISPTTSTTSLTRTPAIITTTPTNGGVIGASTTVTATNTTIPTTVAATSTTAPTTTVIPTTTNTTAIPTTTPVLTTTLTTTLTTIPTTVATTSTTIIPTTTSTQATTTIVSSSTPIITTTTQQTSTTSTTVTATTTTTATGEVLGSETGGTNNGTGQGSIEGANTSATKKPSVLSATSTNLANTGSSYTFLSIMLGLIILSTLALVLFHKRYGRKYRTVIRIRR